MQTHRSTLRPCTAVGASSVAHQTRHLHINPAGGPRSGAAACVSSAARLQGNRRDDEGRAPNKRLEQRLAAGRRGLRARARRGRRCSRPRSLLFRLLSGKPAVASVRVGYALRMTRDAHIRPAAAGHARHARGCHGAVRVAAAGATLGLVLLLLAAGTRTRSGLVLQVERRERVRKRRRHGWRWRTVGCCSLPVLFARRTPCNEKSGAARVVATRNGTWGLVKTYRHKTAGLACRGRARARAPGALAAARQAAPTT